MMRRKYDSTVARIAGNILSGNGYLVLGDGESAENSRREYARFAVALARAVVAEVERTEPSCPDCAGEGFDSTGYGVCPTCSGREKR